LRKYKPRREWGIAAIVGVIAVLLVGGVVRVVFRPAPLRAAADACKAIGKFSDADRTLFLDGQGMRAGSGNNSVTGLECVLDWLHAPESVMAHMKRTRSTDDRQSENWNGFEASWTNSSDFGLDVRIN
jgi:hypothetical protein